MGNRKVTFTFSSYEILFFIVIVITSFLYGCQPVVVPVSEKGRYFGELPLKGELTLGKTVKEEVVNLYGKPAETEIKNVNGINHEIYYYLYVRGEFPKPHKVQGLVVEFRNDIVNGYVFLSSFSKGRIDFDEKNIEKIVVNITKKTDIINLFGSPHGRILLPAALAPPPAPQDRSGLDNAVELWRYLGPVLMRKEGRFFEREYLFKTLEIFFDENGTVLPQLS